MKYLGCALLVVMLLSSVGFANTNVISYPLNDTYVATGGSGSGYNTSARASHGSEAIMIVGDGSLGASPDSFTVTYRLQNFIRTNNSPMSVRWLSSMYMVANNVTLNAVCGLPAAQQIIRWMSRDDWYDSMNYTQSPVQSAGVTQANISAINFTVNNSSPVSTSFGLTDPKVMASFYGNASTTLFINAFNQKCNGLNAYATMNSLESSNPEYFNMTMVDSFAGSYDSNDVSTAYFDFEAQNFSLVNFPQADFKYDGSTNTITPLAATMDRYTTEPSAANTLNTVSCNLVASYSLTPYPSVNFPFGYYDILCFNLTSQHGGNNFYGAIKVLNNTNVRAGLSPEFDFIYYGYSPAFNAFSTPIFAPSVPTASVNLTITWLTSNPMTSVLRFQYIDPATQQLTNFATLSNSSLTSYHALTIPASLMFATSYSFYLEGVDANSNLYDSSFYNFTAIAFQQGITTSVNYLGVFTFNEYGFPTPSGISLDNQPSVPTTTFLNSQNITVYGVSFPQSQAPFGVHTLSAVDYASSGRFGNTTVNISVYPTFVVLTLRPHNSCVASQHFTNPDDCNSTMAFFNFSNIGATGKYCAYDCSQCLIYNFTTGSCIFTTGQGWAGTGANPVCWNLYTCFDGYNPTGTPITPDGTGGTLVPVGGAGGGGSIPAITNPLGSILNLTPEQALNLVAMIISLILTILVAVKTKDGLSTSIVLITCIFLFTLIGWLPWFMLLIFGVIVAFLIAKFVRQVMTPQ